jgi:hypothetical protein
VTPDTDSTETPAGQPAPQDSLGATGGPSAHEPGATGVAAVQERAVALANERPEVAAGAAFAGGLFLALILKRLVR